MYYSNPHIFIMNAFSSYMLSWLVMLDGAIMRNERVDRGAFCVLPALVFDGAPRFSLILWS